MLIYGYMKFSHLYTVMLMLINGKSCIPRKTIADKLGVSERTVQRYIDELIDAGVPVSSVYGRGGGYGIASDYKLPYTLFTADDLDRVKSCIAAMSHSFNDGINEDLLQKLASVASGEAKTTFPPIVIDAAAWHNPEALRVKLDAIAAATFQHVTVIIEYVDKKGEASERLIDPYSLVLKEGVWYVYGWCHTRSTFRTFRLARMRSITLTDDSFVSREDADVYAGLSIALKKDTPLRLAVEESAVARVEEWLGEEAVKQCGDFFIAEALVPSGDDLLSHLLSFGDKVGVLSPETLRESMRIMLERTQKKYSN